MNFYGLKLVAFSATGLACSPLAGNFIYALKAVVLRQSSKMGDLLWRQNPRQFGR